MGWLVADMLTRNLSLVGSLSNSGVGGSFCSSGLLADLGVLPLKFAGKDVLDQVISQASRAAAHVHEVGGVRVDPAVLANSALSPFPANLADNQHYRAQANTVLWPNRLVKVDSLVNIEIVITNISVNDVAGLWDEVLGSAAAVVVVVIVDFGNPVVKTVLALLNHLELERSAERVVVVDSNSVGAAVEMAVYITLHMELNERAIQLVQFHGGHVARPGIR